MRRFVPALLPLALIPFAAADSPEEKKQEEIRKSTRRLAGVPRNADADHTFIRERAQELLERAQQAPAGSFVFKRLAEALDDLLDAGDDLLRAREGGDYERSPDRADTARELEKTYFRVAQAEYFGKVSKDVHGPGYVKLAGRLYQAARREYDKQDYPRARRFAAAAEEIVDTIENLAQAAVPVREPPALEK